MRKVTVLFAITTAGLAVVTLHLARSLHQERARVATLTAALQGARTASPAHQRTDSPVPAANTDAKSTPPIATVEPTVTGTKVAKTTGKSDLPPRVRNRTYREADLAYRKLELQKRFPDLVAVLNLGPDEAEKFFELLAKQQVNDEQDQWNENRSKKQLSGQEQVRRRERRRQENAAEQAAFLGEARTAEWNRYMNSLGGRAEVRELRTLLADTEYHLRGDQYEPLVQLLASEHVRHQGERERLYLSGPEVPTHEDVIRHMGQRLELIEQSIERRRLAAETILDSEQLRRYQSMLDVERLRAQAEYDAFVTLNAEAAREKPTSGR